MKKFEMPIALVSELEIADVITASGEVCLTDCSTNVCATETPIV